MPLRTATRATSANQALVETLCIAVKLIVMDSIRLIFRARTSSMGGGDTAPRCIGRRDRSIKLKALEDTKARAHAVSFAASSDRTRCTRAVTRGTSPEASRFNHSAGGQPITLRKVREKEACELYPTDAATTLI